MFRRALLLHEGQKPGPRATGGESAAEKTGKIAPELGIELGAGAVLVMTRRPLERGAIVEQTSGGATRCGGAGVCGVHGPSIGGQARADDP